MHFPLVILVATTVALAVVALCTLASMPTHKYPHVSWPNSPLRASPQVSNYLLSVNLRGSESLNESGFIGLGPIAAAPFTGNFQNSTIFFNGRPIRVEHVSWDVCRGARSAAGIENSVTVLFGKRVIVQQWTSAQQSKFDVRAFLDGPYAQRCDDPVDQKAAGSCGWGFNVPLGRTNKSWTRRVTTYSTTPKMWVTNTAAAAEAATEQIFLITASATSRKTLRGATLHNKEAECTAAQRQISASVGESDLLGFDLRVPLVPVGCTLWHAMAIDATIVGTDALLQPFLQSPQMPQRLFDGACADSLSHFKSAFSPADAGVHFSGSLPTVETTDSQTQTLLDWSLSALISLERLYGKNPTTASRKGEEHSKPKTSSGSSSNTTFSFPRQYVISDGPSPSRTGGHGEGNSGFFIWDSSMASVTYSLLDPEWSRAMLSYVVANVVFPSTDGSAAPQTRLQLPQAWDNYEWSTPVKALGVYCFDYVATFTFFQSYVLYTGDFSWLRTPIPAMQPKGGAARTPLDVLRAIAWAWKGYPASKQSKYLVDFGENKRLFLEAAENYRGVVPALNAANAGMMFSLANLLEVLGKREGTNSFDTEILELRGNASNINKALLSYQYDGDGAWKCLDSKNKSYAMQVRCICDTNYIPFAMTLNGGSSSNSNNGSGANSSASFFLPPDVRRGMTRLFEEELRTDGWTRALSLKDPSMKEIECFPIENCSAAALVGMRPDWTAAGSYGGNSGQAIDAMAEVDDTFTAAVALLRNLTKVAKVSQPAQGIAVMTPPAMAQYIHRNWGGDQLPLPHAPYDPAFSEFFDEKSFGSPWPRTERSIQNAEASIFDSVVRSIFGWRPTWGSAMLQECDIENATSVSAAISASLWRPDKPRASFRGTLRFLRTPFKGRLISITAGAKGLSWKYEK